MFTEAGGMAAVTVSWADKRRQGAEEGGQTVRQARDRDVAQTTEVRLHNKGM